MREKKAKSPTNDARERLLQAAIRIFAEMGFEAASTRQLAQEADVNISAIMYYYNGKDGLYEAVIRHIITTTIMHRGAQTALIREELERGNLTKQRAKELLHEFMSGFAEFLLSEQATPQIAQIMIREQMRPTSVFDLLYKELMQPMHQTLTQLVAIITGLPSKSEEAILCTHTLFSQVAIFKTHREFVLRRTGWKQYGPRETKVILQLILQNTDAILSVHRRK